MQRHKVFISYHHGTDEPGSGDSSWRKKFEEMFADVIHSGAVQDGDIDPNENVETVRRIIRDKYLFDSSVTVVLVGARTWQRKHVDWEISASISDTKNSPRSGLIGIILPTHPDYAGQKTIDAHTIPPRLYDNVKSGYARLYWWTNDPQELQQWVREAYLRKSEVQPHNSRTPYGKNWTGTRWTE
jgi:hypothetical protein